MIRHRAMPDLFPNLNGAWGELLADHIQGAAGQQLRSNLAAELKRHTVFPHPPDWFRALELTPPDAVRAVIIGQDPYHGPGQAHGLAFSVPAGQPPPPSLRNIFRELADDTGQAFPLAGDLSPWARQGVLLLNRILTVRAHAPLSHRGMGWEDLTDAVIRQIVSRDRPVVFMLWGNEARALAPQLGAAARSGPRLVLESAHPSPLSARRGFFGCRHFSRASEWLVRQGLAAIDWRLPAAGSTPA